jgi:hypothetical protein
MRDFNTFVRSQITALALPPHREQKIVEEWGAQLEEIYDALRADGASDEVAWNELLRQVPDWQALSDQLLDSEPALLRFGASRTARNGNEPRRSTRLRWRQMLTAGFVRDVRTSARLLIKNSGSVPP